MAVAVGVVFCSAIDLGAQVPDGAPPPRDGAFPPRDGFGPPGGPGRGGPGPGGVQEDTKLVKQFDKDGNKRLDATERKAAREFLEKEKAEGRGPRRPGFRGPGGPGGLGGPRNESSEPVAKGEKVSPSDVKSFPSADLYDASVVRTFFIEFENADWEKELADFYRTDVEVPAKVTVDGKTYRDVGVHFRGASSFFTVAEGRKRSLNLSFDFADEKQSIGGYRTINLLNSHTDPTYLRSMLYYLVARTYIPAPKANYARVVINGEGWGVYVSAQQFNKDFTRDFFKSTGGARWKVPGSPRGRGGLEYLGEDAAAYKKIYDLKSKEDPKSWAALIELCKTLNETPTNKLESALAPILNIDGTLKFLALENALINSDGYWTRASDYLIYRDEKGMFHLIPYDANETFRAPEGPGRPRDSGPRDGAVASGVATLPPGGRGVDLDPLTGINDKDKPLLSKLLAVPSLRTRYLGHVRDIAEKWLDWKRIEPVAKSCQALIADDVKKDTHKLYSFEAFQNGLTTDVEEQGMRGPRRTMSLKSFVEQRRAFLLSEKH
jgi:spore coat protein CotH